MTTYKKNILLNHLYKLKTYGIKYLPPLVLHSNDNKLPDDMNELKSIIANCNLCTKANSRKQVIQSSGNAKSDVMFLLPDVSSINDDLNSNYVGKGGEILTNIIKNVLELNVEDIFTTNIIKCFMSNNSIGESEINCCKAYLDKQIDIVSPKVIVGFGVECYQYLYNQKIEYNKLNSQILNYKGVDFIVTHSLPMILRNPTLKKEVLNDIKKVKMLLEKN